MVMETTAMAHQHQIFPFPRRVSVAIKEAQAIMDHHLRLVVITMDHRLHNKEAIGDRQIHHHATMAIPVATEEVTRIVVIKIATTRIVVVVVVVTSAAAAAAAVAISAAIHVSCNFSSRMNLLCLH